MASPGVNEILNRLAAKQPVAVVGRGSGQAVVVGDPTSNPSPSAIRQSLLALAFTAGVAAAAVAATYAWKVHVSRPQVKPEDRVKVGIAGTGWGVKVQIPQFRAAGLEVTAIASRSQDRAITLAAQHHITNPFTDVKAMAESSVVDLVSIVTPPYLHYQQALAVLEGGAHLLLEKPMVMDVGEGERLLAATRAHPSQVAIVDHEQRFVPAVRAMRQALREGAIGSVLFVHGAVVMPYDPAREHTWWADEASGGGALGAIGSHLIDFLRFAFDSEVESVSAHLETLVAALKNPQGSEGLDKLKSATADDFTSMDLRLVPRSTDAAASPTWGAEVKGNAVIQAHMTIGMAGFAPSAQNMIISGSRGSITLGTGDGSLTVRDAKGKVVTSVRSGGSSFQLGTRILGEALQRALGPAQDRSALDDAATIADGLAVQYVMDAARKSSAAGGGWTQPQHIH